MTTIPRFSLTTLTFTGPPDSPSNNAFEIDLVATFRLADGTTINANGFFDGGSTYRVHFSPPAVGVWTWHTNSSTTKLAGHTGTIRATPAQSRGPIHSKGFGLYYADGTPAVSVGTTCYQWASKGFAMQSKTLKTLASSPFNKIRMTIFPKWYVYNHANPVEVGTPFAIKPNSVASNASNWQCTGAKCPSLAGSFDLRRFNVSFWQNYEKLVQQLNAMGVVADVILFHPYDNGHWGFDCLGGRNASTYNTTNDAFYLKYAAARLSAYSNVWWSMANEWSFCGCKAKGINTTKLQSPSPIWDDLFKVLVQNDPYGRQKSIHNGNLLYNHSRPWITHVSLQGLETNTPDLRKQYGKPVVWDEVQYEGDIPEGWGHLSAEEMSDRYWWGASLGVHVGHSETLLRTGLKDDDQPLWWAKGGELIGDSPKRIDFMRRTWAAIKEEHGVDFGALVPTQLMVSQKWGKPVANVLASKDGRFRFVHVLRPGTWKVPLEEEEASTWKVATLDYWRMGWSNRTVTGESVEITAVEVPANVVIVSS